MTATGRPRDERREPVAGLGVEALRQATAPARSPAATRTTARKARLGSATTTRSASATAPPRSGSRRRRRGRRRQEPRVAAGLADRARVLGVAASRASRRARGRRAGARSRSPTTRRRRRPRSSRPPPEVDRDRHALELEPLAQLVLDPVAVVAGDEARVVHREAEARRARRDLRAVEQVEALAARATAAGAPRCSSPRKRFSSRRRDPAGVLLVQLARPCRARARCRGRSSPRW